ncbi:hypothetical protein LZ012_07870 [Dechloromonas sp. XY25]|uniref:DUF2490 domain-containing protein n=1 Tax=Dechloromonas hankyongensis TaxID=2908002 RepID=A0ABS9K172_9RHOO|nr:hypothetical protein [Dechloromonas hankyongensis]MCG2576910.1 hypothetical protein [Dechloromonas hankyongensis]
MLSLRDRFSMALCLALALSPGIAAADWFDEGKAKFGIEYELENGAGNAWQSRGITLVPGLKLDNPWISMVELLLEGAQEYDRESGEHSRERKAGVRIRHEFPLTDDAKIVLRGLLGHSTQGDESFFYYYVEPSFKYAFRHVEMMVGYRFVHGIDASKEHDLHKFRIGPSFDLSERSELEFRWARSWNAHTGQHVSDAYIVEYTQKF